MDVHSYLEGATLVLLVVTATLGYLNRLSLAQTRQEIAQLEARLTARCTQCGERFVSRHEFNLAIQPGAGRAHA